MTRKMMLIAGVAGMALTVPALAQKADRGGGQEKKQEQQAQRGGGGAQQAARPERPQRAERPQMQRVERQQVQRVERPQRMERQQMERAERPQRIERQQIQRAERPQRIERQVQREERQRVERPQRVERQVQRQERQRIERPQRVERQVQRQERQRVERPQQIERQAERQQQRIERQAERPERQQQRFERQALRPERHQQRIERQALRQQQQVARKETFDRGERLERRDMIRQARQVVRQENRQPQRFTSLAAEKLFAPIDRQVDYRTAVFDGNGYRPLAPVFVSREMIPMQSFASKFDDANFVSIGDRYDASYNWSPVPSFYGSSYFDTDDYYYRYNPDYGYAYRIDRQSNLIGAMLPLFGGYGIGDPWPQTYYSSYVPAGYSDYYYDTPDYYYRNDGYGIYQVDAGSQLITALVSLVMGGGFGVGQALPMSYSAYNVPLDYRASYVDDADSWYRYGDGFIYEVDPRSRVVAARYPLYSDNYYVGEQWPVAYPDYNVPYAYRSAYADTPQYQYRYANGGIYQVDPTNQLILALAALVSGDQFAVGQPMPSGYDIYNVPVDYRDRWADSDDEYYRYANGYVYRVDDESGLIEEAYPVYA